MINNYFVLSLFVAGLDDHFFSQPQPLTTWQGKTNNYFVLICLLLDHFFSQPQARNAKGLPQGGSAGPTSAGTSGSATLTPAAGTGSPYHSGEGAESAGIGLGLLVCGDFRNFQRPVEMVSRAGSP